MAIWELTVSTRKAGPAAIWGSGGTTRLLLGKSIPAKFVLTVTVLVGLTVCVKFPDVLGLKLLPSAKLTVIAWLPTLRAEVVSVAVPLLGGAVPSGLVPSLKVTVPVGMPAPGATAPTLAVNVTAWPSTDGLAEDTTVVVVAAWLTICVKLPAVLVL